MTPYLFVLAFMIFILGTVGPIIGILLYELLLKKFGMYTDKRTNKLLRNPFLLNITKIFTDSTPKKFLCEACFSFGVLSIISSVCLMLFIGFENSQTRDLALFVGLWASTLFGLANFFKE
jgi:hypothetical protein